MKKKRVINISFIVLFLCMIIIPILKVNKVNGKLSESEKRYLASQPKLIDQVEGKINTEFFSEFKTWIGDNIGFREECNKLNAKINYSIFGISPNTRVVIGDDDFIFYNNDNNIDIAKGSYPIDIELLEEIKNEQVKIQEGLAKRGIEYILVLTPSKASVYPEKIKGMNLEVTKTAIDILEEYLRENTNINIVNTKDALLDAKKAGEQVFYRTDTHWNQKGAYFGYKELISKINSIMSWEHKDIKVDFVEGTYKGEFSAMMGNVDLLEPEKSFDISIPKKSAVIDTDKEFLDFIKDRQWRDNFYLQGSKRFYNKNGNGNVLIYGDSFFGGWNMMEMMAENFEVLNFIWSDSVKAQVVDRINPEVVIFERTERYINTLAKNMDSKLTHNILLNPNAKILNHNAPTKVKRDLKYDISVTVRNESSGIWSEESQIRLCIWQDGIDYGYRVNIPNGVEVKPGEEIVFTLREFEAPPKQSTFLEFQMLEEGITYFGEKKRVDIVVEE